MNRRSDGRYCQTITIDGKRKYFYGKTKKDVMRQIAKYSEDREKGLFYHDVIRGWQEEHDELLEPSTIRSYIATTDRADKEFGKYRVREITTAKIQAFLNEYARTGYSKKTVTRMLSVLAMSFDYAIRLNEILYNPCSAVKMPRCVAPMKRELPDDDVLEIIDKTANEFFFAYFIKYTGCRRGEALAVTYEDIDRKNKTIRINKSVGFRDNVPFIKPPKTDAGIRYIPLLDKLEAKLLKRGKGLLFPNDKGEIQHNSYARRKWDKWCAENGIQVTPHQLRHFYATVLYDAGIDDFSAMSLLGHSDIKTTRNVYTHISNSKREITIEKLNSFLSN